MIEFKEVEKTITGIMRIIWDSETGYKDIAEAGREFLRQLNNTDYIEKLPNNKERITKIGIAD